MSTKKEHNEPVQIHMSGDFLLSGDEEIDDDEPALRYVYGDSDLRETRQIDSICTFDPHYAALTITDDGRWNEEHNRLLKAKIEFYIESVKQNSEPLKSFKWRAGDHVYPLILLVYSKKPFKAGLALLNELSERLQQEGIPHCWCAKDKRKGIFEEMFWERPKPLTTRDFMDALHRGGPPGFNR